MAAMRDNRETRLVPHPMRDDFRQQQITGIKAEIRNSFAERISRATNRDEKRALKADRDAEIARRIEPLSHERNLDTPECL